MTARYGPEDVARLLELPEPTAEQAAVISAPAQPLAVIAGAGSGKSETMAARLVWLVANGLVRPDRVLGLTFTRKAAAELAERVRSRLDRLRRSGLAPARQPTDAATPSGAAPPSGAPAPPADPDDPTALPFAGDPVISTYHAYAGRLVSDHALREGLEPSMRLITPAESWQLAARIVAAYDGPMQDIGWGPPTVTAAVLALSGELSEHLREPADVRAIGEWLDQRQAALGGKLPAYVKKMLQSQRAREQLLPLAASYAAEKARREVLDHGDQMALAARIASRHPEVGLAERGRYQVVLLDEYQDTSHAQLVLLRALFSGGHPVTAVGDPCQSIYGWRGASAGNLRRFSEDFPVLPKTPRPGVAGLARPGQAAVDQLPQRRAGAGHRRRAAAAATGRSPGRAPAAARPGPRGPRLGGLRPPGHHRRRSRMGGRPGQAAAHAAARHRPRRPAVAGRQQGPGPAVRHRDPVPQAVPVPGPAPRPGGQEHPGRGGRAGRPAHRARGAGRGGHVAGAERRGRVGFAGPAADRPALADRPARPGGPGPPGPGPGPRRPGRGRERHSPRGDSPRAAAPAPADDPDALAEALTDLTTDAGSLVEALDDLGDPAAYSHPGYTRFRILAGELRTLRGQLGRPLPDLIGEVERTLGLDIELASRPGADPLTARADLDAFTDAADEFAGSREEPTLGAFLAYLAAAETEEFGLETGRVGETDSVKLATVHTSKGLQWAAVLVPGLSAGERSQVFPARPRLSTRWTDNPRLLPFGLRGDSADLPSLRDLDPASVGAFTQRCANRDLAEERRLMYVAATRAAFWLGCSGYWWGDGASLLGPSPFLDEVRRACQAGTGRIDEWAAPPDEDAVNPALAEPAADNWPATPAGERYEAVREAAELVTAAIKNPAPEAATPSDATPDDAAEDAALEDASSLPTIRPWSQPGSGTPNCC